MRDLDINELDRVAGGFDVDAAFVNFSIMDLEDAEKLRAGRPQGSDLDFNSPFSFGYTDPAWQQVMNDFDAGHMPADSLWATSNDIAFSSAHGTGSTDGLVWFSAETYLGSPQTLPNGDITAAELTVQLVRHDVNGIGASFDPYIDNRPGYSTLQISGPAIMGLGGFSPPEPGHQIIPAEYAQIVQILAGQGFNVDAIIHQQWENGRNLHTPTQYKAAFNQFIEDVHSHGPLDVKNTYAAQLSVVNSDTVQAFGNWFFGVTAHAIGFTLGQAAAGAGLYQMTKQGYYDRTSEVAAYANAGYSAILAQANPDFIVNDTKAAAMIAAGARFGDLPGDTTLIAAGYFAYKVANQSGI